MIGNGWFKKRKSHKITRYRWDRNSETIIDYFVMTRNLWTVLTDIKVIPSESLGDHRLLVADFRNKRKGTNHLSGEKIKAWKLKEQQTKENYIEILKKKVPRDEIKDVETEWERFKGSLVEAAEEVCGRKKGKKKKHKETPWWTDRIKEAMKKKNKAWRE
jgi:hypothetical protein